MDDPLSLIVWAVFFYSASMMPLGLMLGSACCGCSGDDRVKCFSPTHRCFRTLVTYEDGRKTASSSHLQVVFDDKSLEQVDYSYASLGYGGSNYNTAGVFQSASTFDLSFSQSFRNTIQLSYGEEAVLSLSFLAQGHPDLEDGQCLISNATITLDGELPSSVVFHGWDYPINPANSSHPRGTTYIDATSGESDYLNGKRNALFSKNAVLSHEVVGLEILGGGIAVAYSPQQILSWLTSVISLDGTYKYVAAIPPDAFLYSTTEGSIRWTVRVHHGQAFHDEVVVYEVSPPAQQPQEEPLVDLTVAGVYLSAVPSQNPLPPDDYYDEASKTYHLWPRYTFSGFYVSWASAVVSAENISASQSELLEVNFVSLSWAFVSNPLGWSLSDYYTGLLWSQSVTIKRTGGYFHRPQANLYSLYPCYSKDSDAVMAYIAGEAGLTYNTKPDSGGDTYEYRLEADNPLCGLNVTHLPHTLLPDSVTVSSPEGEPLYETFCDDCPSSVSLKRVSNEVYFSPAADLYNGSFLRAFGTGRSYSGEALYNYNNSERYKTPFAVRLVDVLGHSDAVGYLDGFFADSTRLSWYPYYNQFFYASHTIGGDQFLENFDTPLVKHVTSHEAVPRTIAVHGHKGVYPHSSYKVEVAVSDVEVVTQWERTAYHPEHEIVRKWYVNGSWTTTPTEGARWQDFLEFIQGSYPDQEGQHDLPTTKKDMIIDGIKSAEPTVDEVFLHDSGTYPSGVTSDWVVSWQYRRENGTQNATQTATQRRLKCDGSFLTDPQIARVPSYTITEQKQEDSEGHLFLFSSEWYSTWPFTATFPAGLSLVDTLPPPPDEIPEQQRTYPFNFSSTINQFVLRYGFSYFPAPPNDEDSYEVAFYQPLSTYVSDSELEVLPYTLEYSDRAPYNGLVGKPGVPVESYGVYLLKVTLSVTVTKGDPPSESCNTSVAAGNPDTPAEPISREDVAFTYSTDCQMPATFRGHVWPHAGRPAFNFYDSFFGTTLTARSTGDVIHLWGSDPDGSLDSYSYDGRTPYPTHPLSPIRVGETLYPYPQSTSFRPGAREGTWQGHIYVQGLQYDDLSYSYQYLSQIAVDDCETNKSNWRILIDRTLPKSVILNGAGRSSDLNMSSTARFAMSRNAKFTVVGWYVPDETVRVGYISHKQYGRIPQYYDPSGREETFPGSGWRAVSRYFLSNVQSAYFPPGMVAVASEATCDSSGRFSVELNESDIDGDISIFVQPVNPKTGRGMIEYVTATPTLEECRDYWTFVAAIYVTKSLAAPTAVVPSSRTYYSSTETLADYAVTGGYVVGYNTSIRLVVEGIIKESSVATRVRLYDALSGKAISQANIGGGDFENGLVTISGGSDYSPGVYNSGSYTSGSSESALWFTPNFLFADGQVIQVAAVVEDDLGNESPPTLMSGLIRMDYTSPEFDVVYVNGIEYTSGWLVLNDISKQSPVVISGITEPGCRVKIGNDETVSAGVVTALATTGTGAYSLPTTFFESPIGTSRSGTLTSTDVAKNSRSKSISIDNRLPEVVYARISGGLMECRLNYVQKNATVSIMFLRSDGESSPVLTPDATSGTAEATFTDTGFSVDFLYAVQIEVTIPNGATVFQEQRDVVQV